MGLEDFSKAPERGMSPTEESALGRRGRSEDVFKRAELDERQLLELKRQMDAITHEREMKAAEDTNALRYGFLKLVRRVQEVVDDNAAREQALNNLERFVYRTGDPFVREKGEAILRQSGRQLPNSEPPFNYNDGFHADSNDPSQASPPPSN
jgi:hypothetical protein